MEWVETTGKTNELAIQDALEALGVELKDAEVVVVSPAKKGVFGIASRQARVRVRIRPQLPQRKKQFKRRNPNQDNKRVAYDSNSRDGETQSTQGPKRYNKPAYQKNSSDKDNDVNAETPDRTSKSRNTRSQKSFNTKDDRKKDGNQQTSSTLPVNEERKTRTTSRVLTKENSGDTVSDFDPQSAANRNNSRRNQQGQTNQNSREYIKSAQTIEVDDMVIEQEAKLATDFLTELVEKFGFEVTITTSIEDSQILININGSELGLLVGPKGVTLDAIQDITRTIVQRSEEERGARIFVDVAQYREKRVKALAAFVQKIGEEVLRTGETKKLEPMNSADRKIAHDTVTSIQGLKTRSDGFEPRRCVVIYKDTDEETQIDS